MKKTAEAERRAIVYCRVSTSEQANEEFCSLDVQAERCQSWAQAKGWTVVGVLADTSSGGNMDRPKLQELRERAAAGEFSVVVSFKLDRLSRSVLDFWTLVNELQARGVDVVSVQESFDAGTPVGKLMMTLLASFAEFEREQIVARTKAGMTGRARAGWWPTRWEPLGYTRTGNGDGAPQTLQANADGKWVRGAFARYIDGEGPKAIAAWLNREGVRSSGGRKWSSRMVRHMLSNPVYIGRVRWNDEEFEGRHPAIVDSKTWEEAQRRISRGRRGHYEKALDLARGGYCPALLGRVVGTDGEPFKRYWAAGRNRTPIYYYVDPQTDTLFNARAFDKELLRVVRGVITGELDIGGTVEAFRETHEQQLAENQERESRLKADLGHLDRQEGRLVDAIAAGVGVGSVKGRLDAIQAEKAGLEAQIAECSLERDRIKSEEQDVNAFAEVQEFFGDLRGGSEYVDPRAVLRAVVHRVDMDMAAKRVGIVFRVPEVEADSNPEQAPGACQNGIASPDTVSSDAERADMSGVVSRNAVGVAEGIRTLDLQSHSLSL